MKEKDKFEIYLDNILNDRFKNKLRLIQPNLSIFEFWMAN